MVGHTGEENFWYSSYASSRKQVINQHQRQIDAGSQQHPARPQIPRLSKKNRQHRKDGVQGDPHQEKCCQALLIPQAGLGNEQSLTAFFLMWISLYAVFAVLAVFLGKARYLRPGGVLLAAGVNLTLMLVYYLFA